MRRFKTISFYLLASLACSFIGIVLYVPDMLDSGPNESPLFDYVGFYLSFSAILVIAGLVSLILSELAAPNKRTLRLVLCTLFFMVLYVALDIGKSRWITPTSGFLSYQFMLYYEVANRLNQAALQGLMLALFQAYFFKSEVQSVLVNERDSEILDDDETA